MRLAGAEVLDLCENWIDQGSLPAVKVGSRRVRIRASDLEAFSTPVIVEPPPDPPPPTPDPSDTPEWEQMATALAQSSLAMQQADHERLATALIELGDAARSLAATLSPP